MAVSGKISHKSLKSGFFLTAHGLPLYSEKIVVKRDVNRKIFLVESVHIAIQT